MYTGTRPSRKLRTSRVDDSRWSPAPRQIAGFTHTSGSPCAATRIASTSASCTEFTYGIPSRAAVNSCVSTAAFPFAAGPMAAALDVYTTRSTSARRHSSMTSFVPPTLTSNSSSASDGRTDVTPAQWNTRVTPFSARRTERRSHTSSFTRRQSRSAIGGVGRAVLHPERHVVPALGEQARDVRPDEAGCSGYEHAGQGGRV